jgi:hypothetical protein
VNYFAWFHYFAFAISPTVMLLKIALNISMV